MQTLSVLTRKIRTFAILDWSIKLKFLEAYIYTGIYRILIIFVPFNKLRKRLGNVKEESPDEVDINSYRIARDIRWAVINASRYTPWESKCLIKALTAQRMMRGKGIPTTIYLGVKKNEKNEMVAHAWIRCGSYFITGGENRSGYAVVAKFSTLGCKR